MQEWTLRLPRNHSHLTEALLLRPSSLDPFQWGAGAVSEGSSATPSPLQGPNHWLTIERSQQASPAGSVRRVFWTRSVHFKPRVYATERGDGKGNASPAEQRSRSRIPTSHPRGPDTHCLLAGRSRALRWVLAQPEAPCREAGWRGPRPTGSGERGLERDEASGAWSTGTRHNYQRDGECGGLRGAARRPSPRLEGQGRLGSALSGPSPEALCPAVAGSQQPALPGEGGPGGGTQERQAEAGSEVLESQKGLAKPVFLKQEPHWLFAYVSPRARGSRPQFWTWAAWRWARAQTLPGPHSRPPRTSRIHVRPRGRRP